MTKRSIISILVIGGVLLVSGVAAFLAMNSRISKVNDELGQLTPTDSGQFSGNYDSLDSLTMERDVLASRIPWAIGAAVAGGMCLATGAIFYMKTTRTRPDAVAEASKTPPQ